MRVEHETAKKLPISAAAVLSNILLRQISTLRYTMHIWTGGIQIFCKGDMYVFFFGNYIFQSVNLRTGQFYMTVMFPQLGVKTGIQINKHST